MKLYNNDYTNVKCHRISLFSPCIPDKKTLYYKKKLVFTSRSPPITTNKSYLSSHQKKSRYHFLKSGNKKKMYLKKKLSTIQQHKQQKKKIHQSQQEQEEEHILKLRQEAYADLHATIQHYNDEFIRHMRSLEESSNLFSVPSTDSLSSSFWNSEEEELEEEKSLSMHNLVDLFEAGTIKDYSQLIEWESYQNPPNYFECQGEYGDLW